MTIEFSVIGAFGIISGLLAYYAFKFRESEEPFWKNLSIGFFFTSLLFLDLLMNTTLLIVQNNASLSYLTDSVIVWGLWIMTWITIIVLVLWLGFMVYLVLLKMFELLTGKKQKRAEYDQP